MFNIGDRVLTAAHTDVTADHPIGVKATITNLRTDGVGLGETENDPYYSIRTDAGEYYDVWGEELVPLALFDHVSVMGEGAFLRINVTDAGKMNDVDYWLGNQEHSGRKLASWHMPGHRPGEYSDTFIVYSGEELSDPMPTWLKAAIEERIHEMGFTEGIIWLSFLG